MACKSIMYDCLAVLALSFALTLGPFCPNAAGSPDGRLDRVLRSGEFQGASVSILAVTAAGDTLLRADPERQCLPASNLKLVTTALALHAFGADYRYLTSIGYTGEVFDGVLHGDLYIIGGGDPTLGSHNRIAEPLDSVFARWLGLVRDAGIRRIDGHVIGDGRFFPGMMEQESWQLNDSGTYYGAGVSGLTFYENELDFRVAAGAAEGDPLDIRPVYPEVPWMKLGYACSTGPADSGNTLYFYTTGFAPYGEMRGTFALNRRPKTEGGANKFPEYTVANYFNKYLEINGISCSKGPADLGPVFRPGEDGFSAPDFDGYFAAPSAGFQSTDGSFTVLGGTQSPSLRAIVEVTNRESNNMYAETLLKTLGREIAGEGTYLGAYRAEEQLLSELGIEAGSRAVIRDGSGLSRENHVSAAFLCSFLKAMMQSPAYGTFLNSLPYPGSAGTLASALKSVPEADRQRIRMKSGSMGGVRCYSGYILPAGSRSLSDVPVGSQSLSDVPAGSQSLSDVPVGSQSSTDDLHTDSQSPAADLSAASSSPQDTIIFSILVNNFSGPTSGIQRKIEEIILLLTE